MDFYNMIKNLDDEQIRELISLKIDELTYKANDQDKRFIGIDCGVNPNYTLGEKQEYSNRAMWPGFIPEDIKIVYSYKEDTNGYTVNSGGYYYMDNSLIYDFALYIKREKIENYLDFLDKMWFFIENYFDKRICPASPGITRDEMLAPLKRDNNWNFEPTIEHSITTFKGMNNALCSEYTAVAQNILAVFGYIPMYFIGSVQTDFASGPHAFNIAIIEKHAFLVDFTVPVSTYDIQGNLVAYSPYLHLIDNFSVERLKEMSDSKEPFEASDYEFWRCNGKDIYHKLDTKRYYMLGDIQFFDKNPNYEKKPKGLQKGIK